MALGWQQLLIILVLVLVLFGGRGRISSLMGDMAKGVKSFRKGLAEDDDAPEDTAETRRLDADGTPVEPVAPKTGEATKTE